MKSDILWQDDLGFVHAWKDGDSSTSDITDLGRALTDYDFLGIGDFDGNRKSDILWRHSVDGDVYAWNDGMSGGGWSNLLGEAATADYTALSNIAS